MKNKIFLTIHSFIYAFFALALFFIPHLVWPNYGLQLNDKYAVFLSQHTAIFLGGIAIIGFLFRDVEDKSVYARKILTGLLCTNLLGVIITLYAIYEGIFYGFGWSDPIFFVILSLLCFLKLKQNQ